MRKLPIIFILLLAAVIPSCKLDPVTDAWEYYKEWREGNQAWLEEQIAKKNDDGTPYYNKVTPEFDHNAYVLIRYLNDRSKTEGNLTPLTSSTVDVKYIGRTYDDVAFDSSYLRTSPADSIYRTKQERDLRLNQALLQPDIPCQAGRHPGLRKTGELNRKIFRKKRSGCFFFRNNRLFL